MAILLRLISGLVVAVFVATWVWMGLAVLRFHATEADPVRMFTDSQTTIASILASAVGAGTAAVLGIEIQKVQQLPGKSLIQSFTGPSKSSLFIVGITVYALVGVFILLVWFAKSSASSDIISTFALSILGWLAGAFAAVFTRST